MERLNAWFCPIILINGKSCLFEALPTRATLALHTHIIAFWNQDDPRIENLSFSFGPEALLALRIWTIQL